MATSALIGQSLAHAAVARGRACVLPCRKSPVARRASRVVSTRSKTTCAASSGKQDGFVQFASSIGLDSSEGLFGFKPFAELWVGRLAMMGFITSIVEEAVTGRGTLQQLGMTTPDTTLLAVLSGLAVGGSLVGLVATLDSARKGKLSPSDLRRYRSFLGMKNEAADIAATSRAMKLNGDFTSPDNPSAIAAARAEWSPADAFLVPTDAAAVASTAVELKERDTFFGLDDVQAAKAAAVELKEREAQAQPGTSLALAARDEVVESLAFMSADADMIYAKSVEMTNGRWAMLGFLAAVLVEAGTGQGIIMQIIMWLKFSGLLGDMSGF